MHFKAKLVLISTSHTIVSIKNRLMGVGHRGAHFCLEFTHSFNVAILRHSPERFVHYSQI